MTVSEKVLGPVIARNPALRDKLCVEAISSFQPLTVREIASLHSQ